MKTRKLTRLRRRIGLQVKLFLLNRYLVGSLPCLLKSNRFGLQVKLFLLNLYMVGSLPCILKSNRIGLKIKLGRGEREMNS